MAYVDGPLHTYHIDQSIGREYDPYPASRTRKESWLADPNAPPGHAGSTPRLPPTSPGGYSVPEVHRVDTGYADIDSGFVEGQRRPPGLGRGFLSPHTYAAPRPAFPGGSRFQEMNQTIHTQMTGPTNVSYPDTSIRTDAMSFRQVQSSTPAPTPKRSRYGVQDDNSWCRSSESLPDIEQSRDEFEEREYEQSHNEYDDEDREWHMDPPEFEEETVPHATAAEAQQVPELHIAKAKGRKWSVGGFIGGWMTKSKGNTRAQTPTTAVVDPVSSNSQSAPPQTQSSAQPTAQHLQHSRSQQLPHSLSQQLPNSQQTPYSQQPPQLPEFEHSEQSHIVIPDEGHHEDPHYGTHRQTESPEPYINSDSIQAYAPTYAHDFTQSTHTSSSSSRSGPQTPLEPVRHETIDLPNPYDAPPIIPSESLRASPVQAVLQPAADYSAMPQKIYDGHADTSIGSRINRVGKFITDLAHLPWVAPPTHVAAVYSPAESRRARYSEKKKMGQSWYTKETHEKLDLLASGSPRSARPPVDPQTNSRPRQMTRDREHERDDRGRRYPAETRQRSRSRDAATAIRPTMTPGSITSRGMEPVSPGASSHGQGEHSYSYCYQCGPQLMYMYPTSPVRAGTNGADLPAAGPEGAVPMYVYPVPAGYPPPGSFMPVVPASPGGHHHRHNTRQPTMPFPVPWVPMQVSPTTSRSPLVHTHTPQRSPAQVQPLLPKRSPRGNPRSPPQTAQSHLATPAASPAKTHGPEA